MSIPKPSDTTPPPPQKAVSYCVVCDALPGECDHAGPRYLDPIVYERVEGTGAKSRWHVPDSERWRVDNPPSTWPQPAPRQHTAPAEPLGHLIAKLEAWIELDDKLEGDLRETYAHDPDKTSRLVLSIIEKAESRQVRSPAGLLVTKLRELRKR